MTKQTLARMFVGAALCVAAPLLAFGQAAQGPAAQPAARAAAGAATDTAASQIAPGDLLKITVFQSPDLTLETRVEENGTISYPLIGSVPVSGLSLGAAENRIAALLRDGGFMVSPHVTVTMVQARGSQVTVLGLVTRPGRYPLDSTDAHLTDIIALAGGIAPAGADTVVLTGTRNGKPIHWEIDILVLAASGLPENNVRLQAGDILYVNRAPTFYIYGEVQKPGVFRLERGMTVMQALAASGGLTAKGTQRGLTIHRRGVDGAIFVVAASLDDTILSDDVIYVKESIF